MSKANDGREDSAWAGTDQGMNAHLIPAAPPRRLEIGGAPATENSHEHVLRKKPSRNAQD